MRNLSLPPRIERQIEVFILGLSKIFKESLLSVVLYGSAAAVSQLQERFNPAYSNLNILVLLKSTAPLELKKATKIVNKFKNLTPLFLTEEYISSSTDVFPIEFLDMQENYILLYGKDFLKDMRVDLKNLMFQCEHELKAKLLSLKQAYLGLNKHPTLLKESLIRLFTATLHILRNVLRLKGLQPAYQKEALLKELHLNLGISFGHWETILSAKSKKATIDKTGIEDLFIIFTEDLERIIRIVDAL